MYRQTRLFHPGQFPHLSAKHPAHYVPILQSLSGELQALQHVPADTLRWVTPLIEVSPEREEVDDAPRASRLPNLHLELGKSLGEALFFLDFRRLSARKRIAISQGRVRREVPAMAHVIEQCNAQALNVVPVLYPGIDARRITLLKELTGDGRGVCLRIPQGYVLEATPMSEEIERLLDAVKGQPSCADLLIDLGFIDREPGYDSRDLSRALERVPKIWDWRSLIVAGTVIPHSLAGFDEGSITPLPRHEWRFWNDLQNTESIRPPSFADYGIQHPRRPNFRGWRQMRANIRYSTPGSVLIARGRLIKEHGAEEYRRLCELIVQHPEFRTSSYSWGDDQIARCAAGIDQPGSQMKWRGAGTSHHIEITVEALALSRERPLGDAA